MVNANVHKRAEVRHVRYNSRADHVFLQVGHFADVVAELERNKLISWIASRLRQFRNHVVKRERTHFFAKLLFLTNQFNARAHQLAHGTIHFLGQALEKAVALGVNRRVVERVLAIGNAKEACGLLKRFLAETRHFQELLPGVEQPFLPAEFDDCFGKPRPDARDARQKPRRSRVQVHAHLVHAAIDDELERALQCRLGNVVLILAYADALGFYLHEFSQGVLQAASNRNRATNGEVQFREFFPGHFAGRVNTGACFADHHDWSRKAQVLHSRAKELLGLATRRSVSDCNGADLIVLKNFSQQRCGVLLLICGLQIKNCRSLIGAVIVHQGQFAARTDSGIDTQNRLRPERSCHQELPHVVGKDADGSFIGDFAKGLMHFVFDARNDMGFQCQAGGFLENLKHVAWSCGIWTRFSFKRLKEA